MKSRPPSKRERNAADIKERLYVAAANVVADEGFATASIAKITEAAGVAQGTFYNYFESREAIFEELVPIFGKRMRGYIRARVGALEDFFERERVGFEAFFEFIHDNPFFGRVLNEAEIFTPVPYKAYFDGILAGYLAEFDRAARAGHIRHLPKKEAEAVALVLMSARNYLGYFYMSEILQRGRIPKPAVTAYTRMVRGALAPADLPSSADGPVNAR
jgi:AcrR family transcriptional regulator